MASLRQIVVGLSAAAAPGVVAVSDPVPPQYPFPLTFHTWVVTNVLVGNATDPIGHMTHNYGQLVTFSDSETEQWSCRNNQQDLLHPSPVRPGDFCTYSKASNGSHHRRSNTAAAGGTCETSAEKGEMPWPTWSGDPRNHSKFVGVDQVADKKCNHWIWENYAPGVNVEYWASIDEGLPCEFVQQRKMSDGTWDTTTWAFNGFSKAIPQDVAVTCQALACGAKAPVCAVNEGATEKQLQDALQWVCSSSGLNCAPINQGGAHYEPNTLVDHCNWAFEAYWLTFESKGGTCDFGGAAAIKPACGGGSGRGVSSAAAPYAVFEVDLVCTDGSSAIRQHAAPAAPVVLFI